MIIFSDVDSIEIAGYKFTFIQELNPQCDNVGQIKQFMPQERYEKHKTSRLNIHGKGPFCKFSIGTKWVGCHGVYALLSSKKLLYVGLCIDLNKRFNAGYGNISPKNCFEGGQPTNCKINSLILSKYLNGNKVSMYFHETDNYEQVEKILIQSLNPPYNGHGVYPAIPIQMKKIYNSGNKNKKVPKTIPDTTIDVKNVREYWRKVINVFSNAKIELHTTPKSETRIPLWFSAYTSNDDVYIDNAEINRPSSKISYPRRLSFNEFEKMYPIYLKRKAGHAVSVEATATSHNQVYWYAIMKYCGF